jgi:hypothetical protein
MQHLRNLGSPTIIRLGKNCHKSLTVRWGTRFITALAAQALSGENAYLIRRGA